MFNDLIECEDVVESSDEMFGFSGVTFLRDFGPYKKGVKVETLWFDLATGRWTVYAGENIIAEGQFQLISV